jgi:hypothetical protein
MGVLGIKLTAMRRSFHGFVFLLNLVGFLARPPARNFDASRKRCNPEQI